jgi:hypothetical protein
VRSWSGGRGREVVVMWKININKFGKTLICILNCLDHRKVFVLVFVSFVSVLCVLLFFALVLLLLFV